MTITRQNAKQPVIGLALGSGGARGLAHIGIIKVLLKNNIPIDLIAGSSAGALVGGLYCAWRDIAAVEDTFMQLRYRDILKLLSDPSFKSGIFHGGNVFQYLNAKLNNIDIDKLSVPFSAAATDIISGDTIVITKGNLAEAIRASCSLPGLFKPVKFGNNYLIDGGTSQPVPSIVAKQMGADFVIAVNLDNDFFPREIRPDKEPTITNTVQSSIQLLRYHLAKQSANDADYIITPKLTGVRLNHFINGRHIIKIGEEAAEKAIPDIKKALNSLVKIGK